MYLENLLRIIARNCDYINQVEGNEKVKEYREKAEDKIEFIEKNILPSGSGIDSGCTINIEKSGIKKIVVNFSYHCMDSNGYYDGWIDYKLIITPEIEDIEIKIVGKDYNGMLKDYLYDFWNSEISHLRKTYVNPYTEELTDWETEFRSVKKY